MHCFNMGSSLLSTLCDPNDLNWDIIFIQENWCSGSNLYKLQQLLEYHTFFGISAMDEALEHSVLRGRPWGGVGCLVRTNLTTSFKYVKCDKRFTFIVFGDCLLIVYFP